MKKPMDNFIEEKIKKFDNIYPRWEDTEGLSYIRKIKRFLRATLNEAYSQGFDDGFIHSPLSQKDWDKLKDKLKSK